MLYELQLVPPKPGCRRLRVLTPWRCRWRARAHAAGVHRSSLVCPHCQPRDATKERRPDRRWRVHSHTHTDTHTHTHTHTHTCTHRVGQQQCRSADRQRGGPRATSAWIGIGGDRGAGPASPLSRETPTQIPQTLLAPSTQTLTTKLASSLQPSSTSELAQLDTNKTKTRSAKATKALWLPSPSRCRPARKARPA